MSTEASGTGERALEEAEVKALGEHHVIVIYADDEQVALFRSWLAVAGPPARPLRGSATGGGEPNG